MAIALTCIFGAFGDRHASVGSRTPASLPVLRGQGALPGSETGHAVRPTTTVVTAPEWQWAAMRADQVPLQVLQQAARVTIAVVDTGADLSAPSIAEKQPITYDVTTGTALVQDVVGHGTFVASLAGGAISDRSGMSGFGGDARLMIVRANRGGTGFSDADEASGIVWAVDHGAKIVNLSLGGSQTSPVERSAVRYAIDHGVLLVAAAGNDGQAGNPAFYPAALIGRQGLVVGASTATGGRAPFSTTGSYVDVLAPGVNVLGALSGTTLAGFFTRASTPGATGSYGFGSGTSYAAPEVAGAAALVWAANPALDAAGVAAVIEASASGRGIWTRELAFGTVDVAAAVERATELATAAPPSPGPRAPARRTRTGPLAHERPN